MDANDLQVGKWRVHLVEPGEGYGEDNKVIYSLENASKHGMDLPMVEFYDTSQDPDSFPGGQFVSRYYVSTMLGMDRYGHDIRTIAEQGRAFSLQGDEPSWTLFPDELSKVGTWLEKSCNVDAKRDVTTVSLADRAVAAKEVSSGMEQDVPDRNNDIDAR